MPRSSLTSYYFRYFCCALEFLWRAGIAALYNLSRAASLRAVACPDALTVQQAFTN